MVAARWETNSNALPVKHYRLHLQTARGDPQRCMRIDVDGNFHWKAVLRAIHRRQAKILHRIYAQEQVQSDGEGRRIRCDGRNANRKTRDFLQQ